MKPLKDNRTIHRIIELIKYAFWGVVTTAVNLILFYIMVAVHIPYLVSNIGSYMIAVVFSYIANSKYVFQDKTSSVNNQIKFYLMRIVSIAVDSLLLIFVHEICHIELILSKIIVSVIIIFSTYIGCKFWVFKNKV